MKRILMTGASGYLGKVIFNHMLKLQHEVLKVGISGSDDLFCDLTNSVPGLTTDSDWVIHVAGKAHSVPKGPKEADEFNKVNFEGTKNLVKGIERSDHLPESFVYISTAAVYGLDEGEMITEDHKLNPLEPYGKSKMLAEDFLINWGARNNIRIGIIRPPLVVGFEAPGNLGSILRGIRSGYYFNIANGKARHSMVLSEDLAEFIPVIAVYGGIYHLTDGEHPSFKELSDLIRSFYNVRKVRNLPLSTAQILAKIGDTAELMTGKDFPINSLRLKKMTSTLTFSDAKAREIGWNPRSILKNGDLWLK